MVDACGFRRVLFSVGLTSDRLLSDSIWFLCRSCMIGTLNLAHLGNLWVFPPLMFIFSTIKDLKYSLQRALLLFLILLQGFVFRITLG